MGYQSATSLPLGRLIPVFAGESGLPVSALVQATARTASAAGDSVLIIDCDQADIFQLEALELRATLTHVRDDKAAFTDAKHISSDGQLTLCHSGDASLEELLGIIATLSLSYDWIFVVPPAGCTPAHVRLASASDHALMLFDSQGDKFMRAYWMLDAIRSRAPHFDPLALCYGPKDEAREAYALFAGTVREFMGGPPHLADIITEVGVRPETGYVALTALKADIDHRYAA